jgi:hypothetical protein
MIIKTLRSARFILILLSFAILAGCGRLDLAFGPLLQNVSVQPDAISPNADGNTDATEIRYTLIRSADVSIYFENEDDEAAVGERFYFRKERRRSPGDYSVYWGGVVDELQIVETDYGRQEILSRVLPDGRYRWVIEAVEDNGNVERVTGSIVLSDGDTEVPELHNFAVVPQIFQPNQDSIRDRVSISYYLTKDVDTVQVYLVDPDNPDLRYFVPERPSVVKPGQRGYHDYDYDGGVDLNAEPPPDGTYHVVGEARDRAGNHVRVISELTIEEGGKPRADVARGEIDWQGERNRQVSIPLDDQLCFTAIIRNEGTVPIRTTGPWPGQEYNFSQNYNTLAADGRREWYKQSGVWRFGINYESAGTDFPFRWAVGRPEDLEMRVIDGQEQWYLLPGNSGEVSGCITMDERPPLESTLWWGGLIHEDVAVVNNNIDRISVSVGVP